jgi:hypothetical protein
METIKSSSDRSFGLVFTVVFLLVAAWPLFSGSGGLRLWAGGVGLLFFMAALIRPGLLNPLNRLWTRFGLLLNRVTSPIILAVFFFGVLFPLALLMRLFGKRPLPLSFNPKVESYWIIREPPGPDPDSMKQQF